MQNYLLKINQKKQWSTLRRAVRQTVSLIRNK